METTKDRVGYVGVVALGIAAFALTIGMVSESAMFPRIISSTIAILGATLLLRSFRKTTAPAAEHLVVEPAMAIPAGDMIDPGDDMHHESKDLFINARRFAAIFFLSIAYAIAVGTLGFYTATTVFIPIASVSLGLREPVLIAVTTIIFVGSLYFFFAIVFRMPLAPELLFEAIH
jgi:hypothetical protein